MYRTFILTPNLKMSHDIAQELETLGIKNESIHVVGKRSDLLQMAHLHEASIFQTTDAIPALVRGGLIGIIFSILLCIFYVYATPHEYKINLYLIIAILVFGVLCGAWISSLIGVSVNNPLVDKYDKNVKEGDFMMIVDTQTVEQTSKARDLFKHHANVIILE